MSTAAVIGPYLAAFATLCAVIVALFREEIRKYWHRPILTGHIELHAPDCHLTQLMVSRPGQAGVHQGACYYFRVWVENKGKQRAEKVQVFISRLERQDASGVFREVESFLPMNLRWSHSSPPEIFAEGISSKMGKHCDFGHIIDPTFRQGIAWFPTPQKHTPGQTILELDVEMESNTLSHLLLPGKYRLFVRIAAANADPLEKCWQVNLTGNWFKTEQEMFSTGIGIVPLRQAQSR